MDYESQKMTEEENIYQELQIEGHEAEAFNDTYFDLYELLGKEAMFKIYHYFRGDKIDCPQKMYRSDYIANLVDQKTDRRERARIARAGGYTIKFINALISKRRSENEGE